jgi:hypothetical protein
VSLLYYRYDLILRERELFLDYSPLKCGMLGWDRCSAALTAAECEDLVRAYHAGNNVIAGVFDVRPEPCGSSSKMRA